MNVQMYNFTKKQNNFFFIKMQNYSYLNSCREKLTVEWYSWLISDFLKKSSKTWIQFICMIHKNISIF